MANGGEKGRAGGQEEVAKGGGVLPPAIGGRRAGRESARQLSGTGREGKKGSLAGDRDVRAWSLARSGKASPINFDERKLVSLRSRFQCHRFGQCLATLRRPPRVHH
jgi:hypothetical protein